MQMERKPQQQTLSIRISESLREFLERSKRVISAGREDFVSTSDVAKILLESAKDEGLDYPVGSRGPWQCAHRGSGCNSKKVESRAAPLAGRVDLYGAIYPDCLRRVDRGSPCA